MQKAKITIVLLIVMLGVMLAAISVASATPDAYIKINNGSTIVTNKGQTPQIVVQFGNRGQRKLEKVSVICYYSESIGTPATLYPRAMDQGMKLNSFMGGRADVVAFGTTDLIPGQNYDVAFDLNITASKGAKGTVQCVLLTDVTLAATSTVSTIKVQ
jgi:hypothetical protein